ncbi:MAG: amino acid permease [Candidatus Eremiobacteraeota bacterium]|nr:amino acid permease [Candidatus Eremiobacteraeota bacterium]
MKVLARVKPVDLVLAEAAGDFDPAELNPNKLKPTLGVWGLTALGVGAIIGTGIFVLTGKAAALSAGPAIVLSFVVAGIVSALAALCYAELSSTVPVSGSAYTYVYATLGEFTAWIVGWGLILEYALGAATVAIGWSGYFTDFIGTLGIVLPKSLTTNPFDGGVINLPAALIILLITVLLIRGTSESDKVNKTIVAIKLLVVAFFIVVGAGHVNPANWHPFMPFGVGGIINGAGLVFFAYIGFDAVSTSAEEVRNPARDLPRGIMGSLAVCTVLYIAVSAILTGILPYTQLNVPSPVSYSLIQIGLNWAGAIVAVGAIAGLTTVLLVMLFGQSRVFFAMSRDGLLPAVFSRIHPRFRTPYLSSALVGIVVAAVAAIGRLDVVADLVNIGTLVAFALVSIGVIVLRQTRPDMKRGFRVPGSPVVPALSAVAAIALVLKGLPVLTLVFYLTWLVIGLGVYFGYSRMRSIVGKSDLAA